MRELLYLPLFLGAILAGACFLGLACFFSFTGLAAAAFSLGLASFLAGLEAAASSIFWASGGAVGGWAWGSSISSGGSRAASETMFSILTRVNSWRWPRVRLNCLRLFFLKTRTLSPLKKRRK